MLVLLILGKADCEGLPPHNLSFICKGVDLIYCKYSWNRNLIAWTIPFPKDHSLKFKQMRE
jgi:hypothetical protein